jgi:hypothetical protein
VLAQAELISHTSVSQKAGRQVFGVDAEVNSRLDTRDEGPEGIRNSAELRPGSSARSLLSHDSDRPGRDWPPRIVPVGIPFTKA